MAALRTLAPLIALSLFQFVFVSLKISAVLRAICRIIVCIMINLVRVSVILLAAVVPSHGAPQKDDRRKRCKAICKQYFEQDLSNSLCRPALDLLPRPGVFQSCVMGRVTAFEPSCMPTCMGYENFTYDSYTACKHVEKQGNAEAHLS